MGALPSAEVSPKPIAAQRSSAPKTFQAWTREGRRGPRPARPGSPGGGRQSWWIGSPIHGSLLLFLFGAAIYALVAAALGIMLGTLATTMGQFDLLAMPVLVVTQSLSGSSRWCGARSCLSNLPSSPAENDAPEAPLGDGEIDRADDEHRQGCGVHTRIVAQLNSDFR